MNIDNEWYYPYQYPPSMKDIYNYTVGNDCPKIENNNIDIQNYIQLLIVLPRESKTLLEEKYQKYFNDNSCLYHLYPKQYKIQTFLKKHLWECEPILPIVNLKFIINHIK